MAVELDGRKEAGIPNENQPMGQVAALDVHRGRVYFILRADGEGAIADEHVARSGDRSLWSGSGGRNDSVDK
jgi:hypothetical protein